MIADPMHCDELAMLQKSAADAARHWADAGRSVDCVKTWDDPRKKMRTTFAEMATLGWTGIMVPEGFGGSGAGIEALCIVQEALAARLIAHPLLGASLATAAIVGGGNEEQSERWLGSVVQGNTFACIAIDEGAHHDPGNCSTTLVPHGSGGWRLNGSKRPVLGAMDADLVIVTARRTDSEAAVSAIDVLAMPLDRTGIRRSPAMQIDGSLAAGIAFDDVEIEPGDRLMAWADNDDGLASLMNMAGAANGAEMIGMAQAAFDLTIEYMKTRVQFGRAIGSFQALQHRVADLHGEICMARAVLRAAIAQVRDAPCGAGHSVCLAQAFVGDTLRRVTNEAVQIHGGYGMTNEHRAGRYLKSGIVARHAFGSPSWHRERWAHLNGF